MVGDLANVHWKSVSDHDLSLHPLYCSLSTASDSSSLSSIKQHTPEWGTLHVGRLTTSSLAACLGFYETQTADKLGVPKSLRGHDRIVSVWEHLRSKPIPVQVPSPVLSFSNKSASSVWTSSSQCGGFPYAYTPSRVIVHPYHYANTTDIRLDWGTAQESTAILAVINYLSQAGSQAVVCESGMCLLEDISSTEGIYATIRTWIGEGSLPPIGASPDGIIRYADGQVEVLEVKCVSPFQESTNSYKELGKYRWCERPLTNAVSGDSSSQGIAVWHIPQLQLEMLCAGPECRSALITILYVNGAHIYRIPRNDQYILDMMTLIREFFTQFIKSVPSNRMKPPPINYNFPSNSKLYKQLIEQSKVLAKSAVVVATLENSQIQRDESNADYFL